MINVTRIQDSIHGIIELSELETRIIDSKTFQRLLNVKQLGMAYAVFPGADYSRFAHCVGACHIMSRWLKTLELHDHRIDPTRQTLYRLAALLHDVGHYPYSHCTERAIENFYKSKATATGGETTEIPPYNHEALGEIILDNDKEINEALVDHGISSQSLKRVFARGDMSHLENLLSSDIDADRIDYLRRSAHHTGMPYGTVDSQYLLTELRLDRDERVCWQERALSAADHLLLARFFDYQQVVHNKTVVGLELVLERLVQKLLEHGKIHCSANDVKQQITDGDWARFDDHEIFERIKALSKENEHDLSLVTLCESLLNRNPPRMMLHESKVASSALLPAFKSLRVHTELLLRDWSKQFDIPEVLWFVWANAFQFTKYAGSEVVDDTDPDIQEELAEVSRVMTRNGRSMPTIFHPLSLMRNLFANRRYDLRVYVVLAPKTPPTRRAEIEKRVTHDLSEPIRNFFGDAGPSPQIGLFESI